MKKYFLLSVVIFFSISSFAQNWFEIDINSNKRLHAIDFPSDQIGYIAGDSSRLYKSTDGGFSWDTIHHTGLVINSIQPITQLQFLTNDLGFAVTNGNSGGVFKTTDGGFNWARLPDTITNGFCFFESIYMFDETNGVFGGNGCFSGAIIEQIVNNEYVPSNINLFTGIYETAADIDFRNATDGLAATKNKYIYRTTDGGANWDTIPTDLTIGRINGVKFGRGDTCFASYESQSNAFGILKSVDGGLNWVQDGNSATFYYPEYYCVSTNTDGKIYSGAKPSNTSGGLIFSSEDYISWSYDAVAQPIFDIDSYGSDITFGVGDSGLVVVNVDPSTLSLQENSLEGHMQISAYPNPTNGILNIETTHPVNAIELVNLTGQVVLAKTSFGQENHVLQVGDLESGIYLLKTYHDSAIQTKKIQIKN